MPIHGGTTTTTAAAETRSFFSPVKPRKTSTFVYAFVVTFVSFTLFLAFFSPSPNSSSPWSFSITTPSSDNTSGSHFSSIFSYTGKNSTLQAPAPENRTDATFESPNVNRTNPSQPLFSDKSPTLTSDDVRNQAEAPSRSEAPVSVDVTVSSSSSVKQEVEKWSESLKDCEFFDGEWIKDDTYPLYEPGSCKIVDEQFNCISNGRPDKDFQKLKWKPTKCTLPRLNGGIMLEMLRGRRLAFVGDSLNRNMWESLVCMLKGSVKDESKVYEARGRFHFRGEAEYSFVFQDYNCTVEFFVSPFLVQESEIVDKKGTKKETLRLDLIGKSSEQYKGADIIVFNTGHWWTHEKTSKGEDYYQEGSNVYHELAVLEAFRKALTTWGRWVEKNVNPEKSLVFFRGFSATHFSGGQWNSGGACDSETEPIKNETYLTPYPHVSKHHQINRLQKGRAPISLLVKLNQLV
ncbi:BnaC02g01870D [Brassica napus]|uniref:BnaC02g01870D protein n=1 Tax=Brassica napus TaxID=3708 RepID=A0A078FI24_BRANA|nr:BnaC02g01870D [Brassica napus]